MKHNAAKPVIEKANWSVDSATDVLAGKSKKRGLARLMPFLDPVFIASIAYMDPGHFATNIQGGTKFRDQLLSVIVATDLIAIRTPKEEANLIVKSGDEFREYMKHAERFLSKLGSYAKHE